MNGQVEAKGREVKQKQEVTHLLHSKGAGIAFLRPLLRLSQAKEMPEYGQEGVNAYGFCDSCPHHGT